MLLHGEVLRGVYGLLMWGASVADGACMCMCIQSISHNASLFSTKYGGCIARNYVKK